jgi:hypothetical protein
LVVAEQQQWQQQQQRGTARAGVSSRCLQLRSVSGLVAGGRWAAGSSSGSEGLHGLAQQQVFAAAVCVRAGCWRC